jgi:hypothetical protein
MGISILMVLAAMTLASLSRAEEPAFEAFRWNEDYRYLSEKPRVSTYEWLKYQPLNLSDQEGHLSFGGSARSRVNAYDNDRFGLQGAVTARSICNGSTGTRTSMSVSAFGPSWS